MMAIRDESVVPIRPHLSHVQVPQAIRELPGWLMWRFEAQPGGGKPRKVPYYTNGHRRAGQQGRPEDRGQLTTFDAARAAAARRNFDGVGFAPMPEWGITALDFDNAVTHGQVHPDLLPILGGTYAEFSPSGRGIRAFIQGNYGNRKDVAVGSFGYGLEVFSTKGFVTVTGNVVPECEVEDNANTIANLDAVVRPLLLRRFGERQTADDVASPPVGLTEAQLAEALEVLDPNVGHDAWLQVGMALHHESGGHGFDLWDEWSAGGSSYPGREALEARWASFGRGDGPQVTARSLVRMANEAGAHILINGPASADEFEALVDGVQSLDTTATPQRFQVVDAAEFAVSAPLAWIIKGVLPAADLGVIYGPSGSGKSFMALDMGMAIARGVEWRGHKVRAGRVAYIAAEGVGGFRKRLAAYALHHGINLAEVPLGVIPAAPNMMEKQDAADVARSVRAWGGADLIIVDTFAQVMPGANENAGEDVGKALTHCKRIAETTGAMVVLIHHAGKDGSKGARGWSGLRAAADAELEIVREVSGRAMRLTKSKDGEDGLAWGFDLQTVQLGVDEDLDAITSCVVVEAGLPAARQVSRKLGPIERIVNEVIQECAQAQSAGIEIEAVISEAVARLPVPEKGKRDTRKQHVRRALMALCEGDDSPYFIEDDCLSVA